LLLQEPDIEPIGFSMSTELVDLVDSHVKARRLEGHDGNHNDRQDSRGLQQVEQQSDLMTLIFDRCVFRNNSQAPPVDDIPTYGVVSGRSPDNVFEFDNCLFLDNMYAGVSLIDCTCAVYKHPPRILYASLATHFLDFHCPLRARLSATPSLSPKVRTPKSATPASSVMISTAGAQSRSLMAACMSRRTTTGTLMREWSANL